MVRGSARGSFVLMVGQVVSAIISAFCVIFVARLVGAESYGEYTVVLVPVAIAMLVQDVGMSSSLTRFCAMYRGEGREGELRSVVLVGLMFTFATSLVVSGLLYVFSGLVASAFLQRPVLERLVRIASLAVLGSAMANALQGVMIGYELMGVRSGVQIIWSVLRAVISVGLVLSGYGSAGAVMGYSYAFIATSVVGVVLLWSIIKPGKLGAVGSPWKTLRLLLGFGVPLYMATLVSGGLNQVYNTLMTINVSTDVIGNYGAAVNFGVLISFLTLPIGTVLFPLFSKLRRNDPNLRSLFQSAVKYTSLLTTPVVACILLLSEPLTRLIYGSDYPFVALYLSIYVLTFAFEGLGGVSIVNLVNGVGESRVVFRSNVINFLVGVPLALLLVPRFQILGLLTALIVAPRVGWVYTIMWMRRSLGFTVNWGSAVRVYASNLAAFVVSFAILTLFSLEGVVALVAGAFVFIAVYAFALPLSGALNEQDFRLLVESVRSAGPFAPFLTKLFSFMSRLLKRR